MVDINLHTSFNKCHSSCVSYTTTTTHTLRLHPKTELVEKYNFDAVPTPDTRYPSSYEYNILPVVYELCSCYAADVDSNFALGSSLKTEAVSIFKPWSEDSLVSVSIYDTRVFVREDLSAYILRVCPPRDDISRRPSTSNVRRCVGRHAKGIRLRPGGRPCDTTENNRRQDGCCAETHKSVSGKASLASSQHIHTRRCVVRKSGKCDRPLHLPDADYEKGLESIEARTVNLFSGTHRLSLHRSTEIFVRGKMPI
ncbi:hypothetical protein EVAR_59643_1 [Eumeta japonica]|uniref:Uncharacterized protein n=1 Tax=Eumeta variegata TaxID=151549 RepID=A0A4C1YFB8_EUMVA|nr:hypothetical protein EVAR_59643_1 [Eumeta japonica]